MDSKNRLLFNLRHNISYFAFDFWQEYGDPESDVFPLIYGGPWKVLGLVSLYLLFCLQIGPRYMKNRPAYDVTQLMILYNFFLASVNGLGFLVGVWVSNFGATSFSCDHIRGNSWKDIAVYIGGWLYFVSKFIDFMDTIFFVLRKSYRQVTPLHLFHHSFMPIACYIGLKFVPWGNFVIIPLVNVGIHTLMYFYYGLTAMGYRDLWWKKYITLLQIIQFPVYASHSIYHILNPTCYSYHVTYSYFEFIYSLLFMRMFVNFYLKTYLRVDKNHNLKSNSKIKIVSDKKSM